MLEVIRKVMEKRKENILAQLYKNIMLMLLEYFCIVPVYRVLQLEGVEGKEKGVKHILSARC